MQMLGGRYYVLFPCEVNDLHLQLRDYHYLLGNTILVKLNVKGISYSI